MELKGFKKGTPVILLLALVLGASLHRSRRARPSVTKDEMGIDQGLEQSSTRASEHMKLAVEDLFWEATIYGDRAPTPAPTPEKTGESSKTEASNKNDESGDKGDSNTASTDVQDNQGHNPTKKGTTQEGDNQDTTQEGNNPTKKGKKKKKEEVQCPPGRVADESGDCFSTCPKDTKSSKPDSNGNCQCKDDFHCYDNRIVNEANKLSEELGPDKKKAVREIVEEDQQGKPPSCGMNEAATNGKNKASDAQVASSNTFFAHKCEHCICKKDSAAAAPLILAFVVVLRLFI